jgi:hypothetical protein
LLAIFKFCKELGNAVQDRLVILLKARFKSTRELGNATQNMPVSAFWERDNSSKFP